MNTVYTEQEWKMARDGEEGTRQIEEGVRVHVGEEGEGDSGEGEGGGGGEGDRGEEEEGGGGGEGWREGKDDDNITTGDTMKVDSSEETGVSQTDGMDSDGNKLLVMYVRILLHFVHYTCILVYLWSIPASN